MAVRLGTLWRGEIALPKTFWFFGIGLLMLFSLIFIYLQPIIAIVLGKSSNAILYLDYFLVALYVVYGIFMIVAIWRSSNKYQGSKRWSCLAKLSGFIIVLWFVANLAIYAFIRTAIPPAFEPKIDYVPEKLKLSDSVTEFDSIYLRDFKLKFPFYKEDIKTAYPFFLEHRLRNITIILGNKKGAIFVDEIPDSLPEAKTSITGEIKNWLLDETTYESYFKTMRQVHYASLKDYSWWDLRYNLRLALKLTLKLISIPTFDNLKVYEVETPHLIGYLTKGRSKNNHVSIDFEFPGKGTTYSLHAITADDGVANKIMAILGSIQPASGINEGYRIMVAQYNNKHTTRYSPDLLLLSLISLQGPTLNNLKELLQIEKNINDNQYAIDNITEEINFLSSSGRKGN